VSATQLTAAAGGAPTPSRTDGDPAPQRQRATTRLYWALHDALIMTQRNLRHTTRIPELLVFSIVQPIMFVLLFRYVFGGAIRVESGISYANYLMAGIFVQTVAFGGMSTGVGLAADLEHGLIDRFRSLPMSHIAVVLGRALADLIRNALIVIVMLLVGFAVGFRPHSSVGGWLGTAGLLLLLSFAFSWIGACVGLAVRNIEAVQAAGFIWLLPLAFASSAFVPTSTMPDGLRQFAEVQPISKVVNSVRGWVLGHPVGSNAWVATLWCLGIIAVFMPLAVHLFRRASGKV
jgi:ABC transporter DrrB family efflux protein